MDGFGEPDWEEKTIAWLQESFDAGAIAVADGAAVVVEHVEGVVADFPA